MSVEPGEIHAVLGENGAGKSTLMKIVYGAASPDEGAIVFDGKPVAEHDPATARALGIELVYQHFALFETVSVVENIALAMPGRFDLENLKERVRAVSRRYGLPVEPERPVHTLSVGERQRVEIVRCLLQDPKLLILDEPTSVLTPQAVEKLFDTLRQLAEEGCSILYVSHKLEEVGQLCDRATILRNGAVTGRTDPRRTTYAQLARMMVGSDLPETRTGPSLPTKAPRLSVNGLSVESRDRFGVDLRNVSFEVFGGEVVGIAGVSGNGQAELVSLLSGERIYGDRNAIQVCGVPAGHLDAGQRRELGLAFVPEERLGRGAVPAHGLNENAMLTAHRRGMVEHGIVKRSKTVEYAERVIGKFSVKANGCAAAARSLSGGNLQKYILGREIELDPALLLVSQPTWGLDVGAAAFIRQTLVDMSRSGAAVLIISEELEELFEICDRLLVICQGEISQSLDRKSTTLEDVGLLMSGLGEQAPTAGPA